MAMDRSVRGQILRELRKALQLNARQPAEDVINNILTQVDDYRTDEQFLTDIQAANARFYMVRNKVTGKFATKSWSDGQPIAGKLYRRLADAQMLANRKNRHWSSSPTTDWEVVVTNAPIQFVPIQ